MTRPMTIMAQCTRFSPNSRSACAQCGRRRPTPPSSCPAWCPAPTTMAMCPSVPPTPASNECTTRRSGMPVATASASDVRNSVMKGFSLKTAISTISPTTATSRRARAETAVWINHLDSAIQTRSDQHALEVTNDLLNPSVLPRAQKPAGSQPRRCPCGIREHTIHPDRRNSARPQQPALQRSPCP